MLLCKVIYIFLCHVYLIQHNNMLAPPPMLSFARARIAYVAYAAIITFVVLAKIANLAYSITHQTYRRPMISER